MQTNTQTTYTVAVPQNKAGVRLDKFLSDAVDPLSRARIQALLADGRVSCDGVAVENASMKVKADQIYTILVPPPEPAKPVPQNIPLDVAYEDEDVIVVDKPPGLVVHPAAGNPDGTLVNALLAHCAGGLSGIGGVARPGIVHRLDKGTGGLLIAAKNDVAHESLSRQFADHAMDRAYYALVWGVPKPVEGEVEGNIGRSPKNRKKMAVVAKGGKYALTRYRVLRAFGGDVAALVECRLATGRTHQIRVHMASIGHPVMGDPLYGQASRSRQARLTPGVRALLKDLDHQALYAYKLGFTHPATNDTINVNREIPSYISDLCAELERV